MSDPSIKDELSIFKKAVSSGNVFTLKILIDEFNFDPSMENNFAICDAIDTCHFEMIQLLLSDDRVLLPRNALVKPCELGRDDIVHFIIKNCPDVEIDYKNNTPLCRACANGHTKVVKTLLEHYPRVKPNCRVNFPLLLAVRNRYYEIARILLQFVEVDPYRVISVATTNNDIEMIKLLVKHIMYHSIDEKSYKIALINGFEEALAIMEPNVKKIKI